MTEIYKTTAELREALLSGEISPGELTEEDVTELLDNELSRPENDIDEHILDICDEFLSKNTDVTVPDIGALFENERKPKINKKLLIIIPLVAVITVFLALPAFGINIWNIIFYNRGSDLTAVRSEPVNDKGHTPDILKGIFPDLTEDGYSLVYTRYDGDDSNDENDEDEGDDGYSDTTGAVRYMAIYEKGDISVHFNYTWSNAAFFSVELPKDDDFEPVEYTTANGNTFTYVKNIDWWEAELFSGNAYYGTGSDCSEEEFRFILEKIGSID